MEENWHKEIKRLEGLIKERETSRFRATTTLIQDIVKSYKEDKKVPMSSVKGFIFSLLFPRATIIIASILGTIFVIIQTIILIHQNDIMERQNTLMAFEQTSSIREILFQAPYNHSGELMHDYAGKLGAIMFWSSPNNSRVQQLIKFGEEAPEIVVEAVQPLLYDKSVSVSFAALLILKELNDESEIRNLDLSNVNFSKGRLENANLEGLNFSSCNMSLVEFRNCKFNNCNFSKVNLNRTKLYSSEIAKASFELTNLTFCELSYTKGYKDIVTMAGANITILSVTKPEYVEIANALGAVSMEHDEWQKFKEDLKKMIPKNRDFLQSEIFQEYLKNRKGMDYQSWVEWKNGW
jgi:hypothetical protein